MSTVTLKPNGASVKASWDVSTGVVTIVGSSPQWGDGSDSSYSSAVPPNTGGIVVAPLPALSLPAGATYTGVRAEVRLESALSGDAQLMLYSGNAFSDFLLYFSSDAADPTYSGGFPAGSIQTVELDETYSQSGDPLAALTAGAWVAATRADTADTLKVYEFTVFVDYTGGTTTTPTAPPPLRLTNRSDMYGSARSLTRSDASRQGGNRLTGYL